jgi:hypothetical protein
MKAGLFLLLVFFTINFSMNDSGACRRPIKSGRFDFGVHNIGFYIMQKMEREKDFLPSARWHFGQEVEKIKDYEPYSPLKHNVAPLQRTSDYLPPRSPLKKLKSAIYEKQKVEDPLLAQAAMDLSREGLEGDLLSTTATEVTDRRTSQNLEAEKEAERICREFCLSEEIDPPLDEDGNPIDREARSILEARWKQGRKLQGLRVEVPEYQTPFRIRDF